MTDQAAAQEPTMEEILASIRRIISEDEPAAAEAPIEAPASSAPEAAPKAAAAPAPHVEPDDVLELTERVPEPVHEPAYETEVETLGDLDVLPAAHAEPAAPPPPAPAPVAFSPAPEPVESLLSAPAAEAASTAFDKLSQTVRIPADGRTLEDVVRELLRPLLKTWLDENLPAIVQTAVSEEVERLSRRRV